MPERRIEINSILDKTDFWPLPNGRHTFEALI